MGAEFVFLEFEGGQDSSATGGYAAPSSPEFREKQLAKFLELAPEIDIVITTALIPGRPAPKLWTADMVAAMKPGSVIVDLAAERGRELRPHGAGPGGRRAARGQDHRLHRLPEPHGDAGLHALLE